MLCIMHGGDEQDSIASLLERHTHEYYNKHPYCTCGHDVGSEKLNDNRNVEFTMEEDERLFFDTSSNMAINNQLYHHSSGIDRQKIEAAR
jgi:hypothetical protein